jgi:hypothetical protein
LSRCKIGGFSRIAQLHEVSFNIKFNQNRFIRSEIAACVPTNGQKDEEVSIGAPQQDIVMHNGHC